MVEKVVMSIVKEYSYNIKCDVCGRLYIKESKEASSEYLLGDGEWLRLGGKDYCPDCWEYDEDDNIITSDFKKWNSETFEEIK